jgi:hypothetical protein
MSSELAAFIIWFVFSELLNTLFFLHSFKDAVGLELLGDDFESSSESKEVEVLSLVDEEDDDDEEEDDDDEDILCRRFILFLPLHAEVKLKFEVELLSHRMPSMSIANVPLNGKGFSLWLATDELAVS